MSCTGNANCDCGCCAGTSVMTPQVELNRAGLPAISYRVGRWATFKESMLARLSSSDYPALADLQTRADDDFSIAFLDATSVVLDILTFYQERLANESYLRTATQLESLVELSRLIGYQPAPGVAAACYVAFTLKSAPGQPPDPTAPPTTIPQGTQLQSIPAQDQPPQIFETSADIVAKPDWNALPVQSAVPWKPQIGDSFVYLQGTSTQLQPGDLFLIVGDERAGSDPNQPGNPTNNNWDVRVVTAVQPDTVNGRTYVEWSEGLGYEGIPPAQAHAKFYGLRQRAALFGYNAINPQMLSADILSNLGSHIETAQVASAGSGYFVGKQVTVLESGASNGILQVETVDGGTGAQTLSIVSGGLGYQSKTGLATVSEGGSGLKVNITASTSLLNSDNTDWGFAEPGTALIDLDAVYSKLVTNGWIALIRPDLKSTRSPAGYVGLYQIRSIGAVSRSDYSISGKITRAGVDTDAGLAEYYSLARKTLALAQSEELPVAPQPLLYPLYGATIDLRELRPDLAAATVVALTGTQQKLSMEVTANVLQGKVQFVPDEDPSHPLVLNPGDVVTITDPSSLPTDVSGWGHSGAVTLQVEDASGRPGTVAADFADIALAPAAASDPEISECALVTVSTVTDPYPHTVLTLPPKSPLRNCYNRAATTVNVNVVMATNGQSVSDIMGNGSASTPNQRFTLKQKPLTYIQAPTPTGRQSTLQVQVNGVKWTEAPTLYEQGPSQAVFATLNQSDTTTDVLFGDGVEGATLPTGVNNVQANYRIGSGSAGNVAAGALSMLIDRPLGVSGVVNPEDATGGQDPQSIGDIRANAPQTVLTLGRAVSITDYQNFAATFAGIAKAYAMWIPAGPARGVFLTVAGVNGIALAADSPTLTNLMASLRSYGNPLVPITVVSFLETLFSLDADVLYDPAYDQPTVEVQVQQKLTQTYSFANRSFGQGVSADEVSSIVQAVPGVIAVNVTKLQAGLSSSAGDLAGQGGAFTLSRLKSWQLGVIPGGLPRASSPTRICPYLPIPSLSGPPYPAEILVLDPNPMNVVLGVMA